MIRDLKYKSLVAAFFLAAFSSLLIVFNFDAQVPDHAIVWANSESAVYWAPPCLENPSHEGLLTLGSARKMGYLPDQKCLDMGAFSTPMSSRFKAFLAYLGLVPTPPSRWNDNGSWNW